MVINPIVGVYIPIIRIPVIKGWRSPIPKDQGVEEHPGPNGTGIHPPIHIPYPAHFGVLELPPATCPRGAILSAILKCFWKPARWIWDEKNRFRGNRGHDEWHQPKQCTILREITQNYHTFYAPVIKHSNGKSPFSIGNTSSKGSFSIAMLVYQRVALFDFSQHL